MNEYRNDDHDQYQTEKTLASILRGCDDGISAHADIALLSSHMFLSCSTGDGRICSSILEGSPSVSFDFVKFDRFPCRYILSDRMENSCDKLKPPIVDFHVWHTMD